MAPANAGDLLHMLCGVRLRRAVDYTAVISGIVGHKIARLLFGHIRGSSRTMGYGVATRWAGVVVRSWRRYHAHCNLRHSEPEILSSARFAERAFDGVRSLVRTGADRNPGVAGDIVEVARRILRL